MSFYISRFKNRESIEFDVEVVTPMFLGGAEKSNAELRVPSIKGMLRFWWRAMCGIDDLNTMRNEEAKIFGSIDKKSTFAMRIGKTDHLRSVMKNLPQGKKFEVRSRSRNRSFKLGIIDYLAFGIRDHKKGYTRMHIPAGSKFQLCFDFYTDEHKKSVLRAFHALIKYGGLGAKSRNGFGSITVSSKGTGGFEFRGQMKEFTAVNDKSKLFDQFGVHDGWEDALSEIGMAYKDARLNLEKKHQYDKRLLIAKPIVQTGSGNERHAKPYFLHVNKLDNGRYQGQILFMPYQYYQRNKREKYLRICEKMNKKIAEAARG